MIAFHKSRLMIYCCLTSADIDCPRRSKGNETLPSARLVSRKLFDSKPDKSHVHTLMLMSFGQLVDHDMTKTALTMVSRDVRGSGHPGQAVPSIMPDR